MSRADVERVGQREIWPLLIAAREYEEARDAYVKLLREAWLADWPKNLIRSAVSESPVSRDGARQDEAMRLLRDSLRGAA